MTWLGPPGQVHAVIAKTWAQGALSVSLNPPSGGDISISAQRDDSTNKLVIRLVNTNAKKANITLLINGFTLSSNSVQVTTISGTDLTQTNNPSNPLAISPIVSFLNFGNGINNITVVGYSASTLVLAGSPGTPGTL